MYKNHFDTSASRDKYYVKGTVSLYLLTGLLKLHWHRFEYLGKFYVAFIHARLLFLFICGSSLLKHRSWLLWGTRRSW